MNHLSNTGALPEDTGKPHKTPGIDPPRAPDRWISVGGKVFRPTPAVGDHPGVLPVSSRLLPNTFFVVLLDLLPQLYVGTSPKTVAYGKVSFQVVGDPRWRPNSETWWRDHDRRPPSQPEIRSGCDVRLTAASNGRGCRVQSAVLLAAGWVQVVRMRVACCNAGSQLPGCDARFSCAGRSLR